MAYASITKPSLHFNTKLYTGNAGTQSITGVGFQPDLTWIKRRNTTGGNMWTDAVRGVTKTIISNETSAEQTFANGLTAFGTDGFTVGSEGGFNGNSDNFASWNWKAGGGQGSSNTDGSINTTYTSVNTTAGFSICKWSGTGANATIGHGLGAVPKMFITKSMASSSWCVYHASLGNTKTLFLESNGAGNTHIAYYNNTSPTSSVFSVGTDDAVNHSGNDMIAYCFAEKKGYSKFGSYTGNANANGTFVYTGFVPAFVLIKSTASSTNWAIIDNKRPGYNPANAAGNVMFANTSAAESSSATRGADFLSNGFKVRGTNNDVNGTSEITYMAFAENPIVGTNNIPATAR